MFLRLVSEIIIALDTRVLSASFYAFRISVAVTMGLWAEIEFLSLLFGKHLQKNSSSWHRCEIVPVPTLGE
jgi:hypothetical protein